MVIKKIPWTRYEAVLLLNAYILVAEGKMSRQAAIRMVSKKLRQMGINNGVEIDPIYRNENGITFQMHAIESAYRGETIIKPATKLFTEVVKLYKDNPDTFSRLLKEAEIMVDNSRKQEKEFMTWLANQVPPGQFFEMYMAFKEIEQFAIKEQLVKKSLFRQIDLTTVNRIRVRIDGSSMFKFIHKKQLGRISSVLNYLSVYLEKRISELVVDETPKGMLTESGQSITQEKERTSLALKESEEIESDNLEKEEIQSGSGKQMINDQSGFYHWLLDVKHMADATCRSYVSAINTIEKFAMEHNMPEAKLYLAPLDEIKRISAALLQNQEFLRYNAIQHNRFRIAIIQYLDYCQTLFGEHKATTDGKSEIAGNDAHQKQIRRLSTYNDTLYRRLYAMSQVYRDPQGLTIERIQGIVGGIGTKISIIEILESVDWAVLLLGAIRCFQQNPFVQKTAHSS